MKNLGKQFEQSFRKSIPESDNIYYYRLKDTASSYYGGNESLRFSQSNIADAFMFYVNEYINLLLILEFKHHKGKSLPINCIRENQLKEMLQASKKKDVVPMLVVFFSDVEKCFSIPIEDICNFISNTDRKSIPLEYFEQCATPIEVIKLRTNYKFNVEQWLNNI